MRIDRQQAAAFKVNEVCRHHDEFAGKFDIELLESLKIFEVLASDALDGNVVDVDLVLFNQVKQKVEWPFEDLELDLVIGFHALAASLDHREVKLSASPQATSFLKRERAGGSTRCSRA